LLGLSLFQQVQKEVDDSLTQNKGFIQSYYVLYQQHLKQLEHPEESKAKEAQ
jgi:hypothetical protein